MTLHRRSSLLLMMFGCMCAIAAQNSDTIPGTTAIGTSAAVLKALKTKGEAELSISNAYAGLELTADRNKFPSYYHYQQAGKIRKVGAGPIRVSVLVNDRPVELPAIKA